MAKAYRVNDGRKFRLKDFDPADTGGLDTKEKARGAARQGRREAGRAAGDALRPGPLGAAPHLPGHGRRGQGQHHQARDVGREPAGLPGLLVQGALRRGARPRLPVAHARSACPSAAASASSTAPTTRRSWSSASTRSSSAARSCRRSSSTKHIWKERFEDITPSSATSRATASSSCKFFLHVSQEGAEEALPRAARRAGEELEVLRRRTCSEREHWDDVHGGLRGHDPQHRHRARALVRGARRQQVVHAARGGGGDRRRAGELDLHFPRWTKRRRS